MIKTRAISLIAALLATLSGCSSWQSDRQSSGSVGYIEADDLPKVEAEALSGDKRAVVRLINYDDFGRPGTGPIIDPDLYKWSKVAVQYGMAEYSVFALQNSSSKVASCDDVESYARGQEKELLVMISRDNPFVGECLSRP